ncbi:MAG: elongation factor P maturation arginine rhamnosyltransferase EarP [Vitreoscilla sp.]|nr:elongation factor P maturation arginine rhamnosyltransferase EarP [Polaromonas sp.]
MRSLQWDIFCKVIDNFGDIGVCWRLAADLAIRGQRVRLWVDDGSALAWMAPDGCDGVQVLRWTQSIDVSLLNAAPCDVLIEAFGCEIAPEFIAACACIYWAGGQNAALKALKPLWINLEYLSAEPYVTRCHGLKSLISSGPGAGWNKVFYYPGFTAGTGGLLREADLQKRQAGFDRAAWLRQQGIDWQEETLVSLFCYEPPALAQLLAYLQQNGINRQLVRLMVAAGRATEAVKALKTSKIRQNYPKIGLQTNEYVRDQLLISYLPQLSQTDFDRLLWASDINFVRGEDSVVRAIWAGKPFVWQIYPQDDGAHGPKLEAFLDMLGAPTDLRAFHRVWNGLAGEDLPPLPELTSWQQTAKFASKELAHQPDLTSGLIEYARKNR